jgi:predicted GNAT family acetyltransferase
MPPVHFKQNEKGQSIFFMEEDGEPIAEMVAGIVGNELTVYHTEVFPKGEGRGLGKELLRAVVEYARMHDLKVIPLCPFVLAQFARYPEQYSDIWKKTE